MGRMFVPIPEFESPSRQESSDLLSAALSRRRPATCARRILRPTRPIRLSLISTLTTSTKYSNDSHCITLFISSRHDTTLAFVHDLFRVTLMAILQSALFVFQSIFGLSSRKFRSRSDTDWLKVLYASNRKLPRLIISALAACSRSRLTT
ncbi:hypothetical protein B0J17DRAFT_73946 [Rhizoctonia solani]|nr:hypothetical protein B0J17DRAFT_73946 [Rhizoctonia solani]